MQCPAGCDATLVMTERQHIEIDYCPSCRGVWLDRGELDKIIERSAAVTAAAPPPPRPVESGRYDERSVAYGKPPKKKKAKSFIEDVFDFG